MAKSFYNRIRQKFEDLKLDVVLPIFALSLVLEMVYFFPDIRQINIWDEATYIHNGYLLLTRGILPNLAGSPLSSVLYAVSIAPVFQSADFFVLGDAIARVILFTLIFFSLYLIARELKSHTNPWIMLGFIILVPVASTMYLFPSDILFAGFSGLAFWQMLAFYHGRRSRNLWWASALMGLGALTRAEGLILIVVMLIVTLVIELPGRRWYRAVAALLIPFVLLVGGYVLGYGLFTGDFGTGLPERTFNNFESGHEIIYSQTGVFSPTISARLESRQAFGSPEENNYSVFTAIVRNPQVYTARLKAVFPVFWNFAVKAYGNKFILIFIWLSLRGLVALIKRKHLPLVLLSVLWFSPLAVGFLNTFFREGYFMMPYFVVFTLSSIGLASILDNLESLSEKKALVLASALVLMVGVLTRNPSMVFRNGLFIFGLAIIAFVWQRFRDQPGWRAHALWFLLGITLIIRGGYPSPELPDYGRSDLAQSIYFLQDHLPGGSDVLAGAPATVWAARMTYFGINSYDIPDFKSSDDFLTWVRVQGIDAIYIDLNFPEIYRSLVIGLSGQGFEEVYTTPERDILIYLVSG